MLIEKFLQDIDNFVSGFLYKIESDIYQLNRALKVGHSEPLESDLIAIKEQLESESGAGQKQLERSIALLEKRIKSRKELEGRIRKLILTLLEVESQLDIFYSTIASGQFDGESMDAISNFQSILTNLISIPILFPKETFNKGEPFWTTNLSLLNGLP